MITFIVDDDKLHHFGMKRMLHHMTVPTKVMQFYNGLQAIEFLEQHKGEEEVLPDVIFLDINMPVMNGWQFLESFIELNLQPEKPITIYIVTSSVDRSEMLKAASYKEITNYIIKPISIQSLESVFKEMKEQ